MSFRAELTAADFVDPQIASFSTSALEDWPGYVLDQDESGSEYRRGSLYVEAFA